MKQIDQLKNMYNEMVSCIIAQPFIPVGHILGSDWGIGLTMCRTNQEYLDQAKAAFKKKYPNVIVGS